MGADEYRDYYFYYCSDIDFPAQLHDYALSIQQNYSDYHSEVYTDEHLYKGKLYKYVKVAISGRYPLFPSGQSDAQSTLFTQSIEDMSSLYPDILFIDRKYNDFAEQINRIVIRGKCVHWCELVEGDSDCPCLDFNGYPLSFLQSD